MIITEFLGLHPRYQLIALFVVLMFLNIAICVWKIVCYTNMYALTVFSLVYDRNKLLNESHFAALYSGLPFMLKCKNIIMPPSIMIITSYFVVFIACPCLFKFLTLNKISTVLMLYGRHFF